LDHGNPKDRTEDDRAPAKPITTSSPEKRELTEKEALFVAEYMVDLNATQAYLRSHPGVAYSTASTNGIRLLGYAWIQDAIAAQRAKTFGRLEITREHVLLEAARLAFFDPRRMYRADGSPIPINELDDDTAACIWDGSAVPVRGARRGPRVCRSDEEVQGDRQEPGC